MNLPQRFRNTMCVCDQQVQWVPGSLWDSYVYQEHDDDILNWKQIMACVPGRFLYPVAEGVDVHPNRNLIWNSDLVDIIEIAWSAT